MPAGFREGSTTLLTTETRIFLSACVWDFSWQATARGMKSGPSPASGSSAADPADPREVSMRGCTEAWEKRVRWSKDHTLLLYLYGWNIPWRFWRSMWRKKLREELFHGGDGQECLRLGEEFNAK